MLCLKAHNDQLVPSDPSDGSAAPARQTTAAALPTTLSRALHSNSPAADYKAQWRAATVQCSAQ